MKKGVEERSEQVGEVESERQVVGRVERTEEREK